MSTGRKNSSKNKVISLFLVIAWMILIFANSAVPGDKSDKESHLITDQIVACIRKVSPKAASNVEKINHLVRKNGHCLEYFILALLVANVLRRFGKRPKEVFITILFVCLLYAVSDEFHQSFVPGRSCEVLDVIIDFSGSFIGTIVYYFVWAIRIK